MLTKFIIKKNKIEIAKKHPQRPENKKKGHHHPTQNKGPKEQAEQGQ